MRIRQRALTGVAGALLFLPAAAQAQASFGPFLDSAIPLDSNRGRNTGVLERPRPEYEPTGVNVGGFTVLPRVQIGTGVSSNVLGLPNNPKADVFFTVDPEITVRSNFSQHEINVTAGGQFRRFATYDVKNENGLFARVDGRLDVNRDTTLFGAGVIRRSYEAQYSSAFPAGALSPVEYIQKTGIVRGAYQSGPYRLTLAVDMNDLNFRDLKATTGAIIDQDFRDRTVTRGSGRVEYGLSPDTAVFVEGVYSDVSYHRNQFSTGTNRNGGQIELLAGTTFDITSLVRARIGAGYIRRRFESPLYRTLSGFAYDARIEYFPSGLTTLTLGASRSIEESVTTGSSGYFSSSFIMRADHELLRNFLLFGQGEYQRNNFQGITRRDELWRVSGGANYRANRGLTLGGSVSYLNRDSQGTLAGQSFSELRGTLSVTLMR